MSEIKIREGECWEDTPKALMARVTGLDGANVTQSSFSAASYLVKRYDTLQSARADNDGQLVTAETAFTVSSLIYNSPQTDNDWDEDTTGYNLKATINSFPYAGYYYRVEMWGDPTSGDDFLIGVWILYCNATIRN